MKFTRDDLIRRAPVRRSSRASRTPPHSPQNPTRHASALDPAPRMEDESRHRMKANV